MKQFLLIPVMFVILALSPLVAAAQATGSELADCQAFASKTPLVMLEVTHVSGGPYRLSNHFSSPTAKGLLCVENRGTTSGSISLNGSWVVAPSEFKGAPALIAHSVMLKLGDNLLIATISGQVGQSFTVRVYAQ